MSQKTPPANNVHFQILVAGRPPIAATGTPDETLKAVVQREFEKHGIALPSNATGITYVLETHGPGGLQRATVNADQTLAQIGVRNGDRVAVTWSIRNG